MFFFSSQKYTENKRNIRFEHSHDNFLFKGQNLSPQNKIMSNIKIGLSIKEKIC